MNKDENFKSIISNDSQKYSINEKIKINDQNISNKISEKSELITDTSSKKREPEININVYEPEFSNFKSKNVSIKNSNKKYEKNSFPSTEEKNIKKENKNEKNSLEYIHYKNLSNTNEKKPYDINNKFNQENKLKKNIYNYNTNKNKANEIIKNKNSNKNKNENNIFYNNNYAKNINKYKKKINNNSENKLEKLLSLMNQKQNKNIINNITHNYMKTNPNNDKNNIHNKVLINCNSDMKANISNNKNYEKSCPKLNLNKNNNYGKIQNTSNTKQLNYEQINEDNNDETDENRYIKKPSIDILKSIKGNLMPYYNSSSQNISNELNIANNKNNFGSNQKFTQTKNEKSKNIINFFLPNKNKIDDNQNEINNAKIGNLQNIILENDEHFNDNNKNIRMSTQANNNSNKNNIKINNISNNNLNGAKIINKSNALRKIRTINDKNEKNNKKDLSLNNNMTKKRRTRFLESELNSNIIDSTSIFGNNIKNKNAYMNLIRKAFNNKNKNYYINFISNKINKNENKNNEIISENNNKLVKNNTNYLQKSVRDSKSLNVVRNRSNNNFNNHNNIKKIMNTNEPYLNKIMKIVNNKDKERNYSVNEKYNEYHIKKTEYGYENAHNNMGIIYNSKNDIDENKISENIENNSINTYSIFIFQKHYKNVEKIGLKKIKIFDMNNNELPVIFYQTNADYDNGKLFNTMMTDVSLFSKTANLRDEILDNDIPFITEIKKDINIYFHINSIKSNNIKYIQIINYNNHSNSINSVKHIEIFKAQNIIYKGILNDSINIINLSTNNNKNKNLNYITNIYQDRPFSTSKIRVQNNNKLIQSQLNSNKKNSNDNNIDVYHTARNNLFNKYSDEDNSNGEEFKENNIKLFNKTDQINKIENSKKNLKNGSNTINIHINNNTNNITNLEIFEKNEKVEKDNDNNLYYEIQNSSQNNNKEINNDYKDKENINESSNNNNSNGLIYTNNQLDISFNKNMSFNGNEVEEVEDKLLNNNKNNSQTFKDINSNENNYIEKINTNLINSNDNLLYTNNILYNTFNNNENNYIFFNRIKLIITSNYGHKKHVGLTGIEFYNIREELINIEKAIAIGASPKDLRTIYDDENDNRIFENVFNNVNNTDDPEDMWVTKLKKSEPKTFIEIYFKEKIKVSKIKFYNYNEKNNLHIGAKTIELYLDEKYYGTIYLKPGVGEIAHDSIQLNKDNNDYSDSDDGINHFKEDFGQTITFPIKNLLEKTKDKINKFDIKHASFLYEQSYETPFMPCGYYIKFEFLSNYYKGIAPTDEAHPFKYKDIGLDGIEIYNNENINIISNKTTFKYKVISNREFHNKKNKIILNGAQNDDGNNCLFYIFEEPVRVSYIKFNPLTKKMKPKLNTVKEIKIYCEAKIIFEGDLYLEHPTVALFTCDTKIKKNIDDKFLTQKTLIRDTIEIKNDQYFSLILN